MRMRQLSTNLVWVLSDRVVRFVIGSVLMIAIAHHLGAEEFGALSFAMAMVTLCTVIANPGLDSIVIRELAHQPTHERAILKSALRIRLAGSTLATLCCWCLTLALQPQGSNAATLAAILSLGTLAQSFDVYELWFQAKVQSKYSIVAKIGPFLVAAGVRVWLLAIGAPAIGFAVAQTLELALACVCLTQVFRSKGVERGTPVRATHIRELLAASWPLAAGAVAVALYMRIDQVLLAQFFDQRAIGIYGAAVRLSEIWYLVPLTILSTLAPITMRLKHESSADYRLMMRRLYCFSIYVGLAGAIAIQLTAGPLVAILLGQEFVESTASLKVLAWSAIPILLGVASSQYIVAENLQHISLLRTALGLVACVALNLLLIPRFGLEGAALATALSYAVPIAAMGLFAGTRNQLRLIVSSLNPLLLVPKQRPRMFIRSERP